ncbi:hypothetical protein K431DRAFT_284243 [Polychaeton citri CBS 116435]|uniref:[histone H3]-trimethyl-L-lysine(9) demethylase n=1 Tax=Polychaeton citri CBS 116435 TaxID=1314669 RepID=A0A9P4QBV9_9PEZI|nr:hypothetical protein K431DRAFT_284243 [Polychaeton citri CBS 116435]
MSAPTAEAGAALSPASHGEDIKPTTEPHPAAKPASALTPPTSEEMNHDEPKQDDEESELSDLDMDDDDEEEIEPDHYWDGDNGGRIPVFKPTSDQFQDFQKFINKINKYGMKSGIVKVIAPQEWRDNLPALEEYVKHIKIKNPITQEFNGSYGQYTQQNVEKQRSYNLPEWKALCEETQHQPPAKRGERRRNQEKVVRGVGSLRGRNTVTPKDEDAETTSKRRPGRPKRGSVAPSADADATQDSLAAKPTKTEKKKPGRKPGGGQAKSVSSRRLNNTAETADYVDEAAFEDFKYRMDGLEEFTPERCAELESHYWKSLSFNQPMYAADMPGSLFDDTVANWNVAKLPNLLDVLGTKVPGVNTAYLYMGMWKATFAWHLEDVDLYSINYIHFGAPKHWYSISQEDARRFEAAMRNVWPLDAKNCDQFLRHKTYLISPDKLLKDFNVKVNKLVHYEGEFVITYPYGYHSGFNLGYNCAESVNFAIESWLDYGRIARKCNCEADNVWVDVADLERKLRGEPTPEYYEETDDEDDEFDDEDGNLPSPPASVKAPKTQTKKRKRETKPDPQKKKKKIRIRIRKSVREPCALCPNDAAYEPLLPTDNGKKAHRSCALFTPETWVVIENGKERVCGAATIDRARLELKCNFCRSKRGACFQCSSKKCTRAFHATCALAAGVQIDCGPVPTFGEDGTEYFEEGYDFRCRFHRPKMPKNVTVETLESNKRVHNFAKEVQPGDVVQAQYTGSDVFAGLVVENRSSELALLVDVLPEGDRVELDWKWLCVLDPDDSQRPKPSASAVPMPEGMSKKAVSIENRQDGVPSQDQLFHDNADYKWREFVNMDMQPQGYAYHKLQPPQPLKVDFNIPDQLYFYLPALSTEARCYFTDTPSGKTHVAKSNFMDRVTPRPAYQPPVQRTNSNIMPYPGMGSHRAFNPVTFAQSIQKPYVYKPRDPAQPNMVSIDHRALANQRTFTSQGTKDAVVGPADSRQEESPSAESSLTPSTPLRPFSQDHYYSTTKLPAAYSAYSQYQNDCRRQSTGSQSMPRFAPQNEQSTTACQSEVDQRAQIQMNSKRLDPQFTSSVPVVSDGFAGSPESRQAAAMQQNAARRPSTSSQSQQSQSGAPLTPATTVSSLYKGSEAPVQDGDYLKNLSRYPYLLASYCRKPRVYESPYPIGGGFNATWQTSVAPREATDQRSSVYQSPYASTPASNDASRRSSQQWTPPSQVYQTIHQPLQNTWTPDGAQTPSVPPQQHPHPVYQTAHDFQRSLQREPSVASRDGAQQRMLRDLQRIGQPQRTEPAQYNTPYPPQIGLTYPHDVVKIYSPQAPTPSPLSERFAPVAQPSGASTTAAPVIWNEPRLSDPAPLRDQSQ